MMILKVVGTDVQVLEEIAQLLIDEKLIAVATIEGPAKFYSANSATAERHVLSGISKSLLFRTINEVLRKKYGEKMPLLYSEPIIMLDPDHTEKILAALVKT
ncbi:MAG: hypothetical protein R3359_02060 [Marinirhabdus sp.]|nr:hypothetical protein [Marinirhabdus sp.]